MRYLYPLLIDVFLLSLPHATTQGMYSYTTVVSAAFAICIVG